MCLMSTGFLYKQPHKYNIRLVSTKFWPYIYMLVKKHDKMGKSEKYPLYPDRIHHRIRSGKSSSVLQTLSCTPTVHKFKWVFSWEHDSHFPISTSSSTSMGCDCNMHSICNLCTYTRHYRVTLCSGPVRSQRDEEKYRQCCFLAACCFSPLSIQ